MHEHIKPQQHDPNPEISQNSQKTQKFSKTPKPRSKMHECMKNESFRTFYQVI